MKLKTLELDGRTYAEVEDGKPVFVADDGKAIAFDAPHTVATIARLNGETKAHREAREAAEGRLKGFEGIEDPDAARSALETIRNLKDGDLVKAGEVEVIKNQAKKTAEEQVAAEARRSAERIKNAEKERDHFKGMFTSEKIGRVFSGSKFIADKCTLPAPIMQAQFGNNFRVEDGRVVAYDGDQKIFSRTKPGDIADPDEALEILVDGFAYRDSILKGTGSSGSGARPGTNAAGQRQMSRKEFDALSPGQKSKLAREVTLYD
jgi:hypothetical protein